MPPAVRPRAIPSALIVLAVAFAAVGAAGPAAAQPARLAGLDAYIEKAMRDWEVPGLAIAIVHGDSVVFARGYGVRELGRPERVDEHTLFAIASTTKAMTTAALAMLVEDGRLGWDDRVTEHLPELQLADPFVTRAISVRDLVTHRIGVGRFDNLWIAAPFDRAGILRRARHLPTVDGLRERYGYNNIMYIAAGEVAARAAGTSWDELLERRLFRPLGMTRSTTREAVVATLDNVAASHTRVDGNVRSVPRRDYDNIGGAGAAWSSVHDMAQWLRLHLNGGTYGGQRLLSEAALHELYAPQTIIAADTTAARMFPETLFRAYGLGWIVQDHHGRKLVHHSGSINYMRTQVGFMPAERVGVVAIANQSASNLQLALMHRVLDAYLGRPERDWSAEYLELARRADERTAATARELEAARAQGTRPSAPLERYAGTFASDLFGELRVAGEGGGLVLHYSPEYVADLEHWHHDIFRAVWRRPGAGRAFVTFTLDPRGRVPSLELDGFGAFRRQEGES